MTPSLQALIQALRCLPGVGPKSAQRMAFQILARQRQAGLVLAEALTKAVSQIGYCQGCRTFSETAFCDYCSSEKRDKSLVAVVESPADLYAIEQTGYRGLYFVLHGRLSPLDGLTPKELGLDTWRSWLGARPDIREIIVATNPTLEGEATAYYIAQIVRDFSHIHCSRIAQGVPRGGELEWIDSSTLTHAFLGRSPITENNA